MNQASDSSRPIAASAEVVSTSLRRLRATMAGTARGLIIESLDMADPANQSFADRPDDPAEHAPSWHQYGIITHSEEFYRHLHQTVPAYLVERGLGEPVESVLSELVDGVPKRDLLSVVALVHDVGKFTARSIHRLPNQMVFGFAGHEADSGRIVRGPEFSESFTSDGLTAGQIEYVAQCAELHFELGKLRLAARSDAGYTMRFTESAAFRQASAEIMRAHPDYAMEIGLEFIADSLAKTELAVATGNDEEIAAQRPALEAELAQRGLDQRLINQVLQMPVNIAVAESYLRQWAESR